MASIHNVDASLPAEALALPVEGQHLGGAKSLGELLAGPGGDPESPARPTLLAFLRHFG